MHRLWPVQQIPKNKLALLWKKNQLVLNTDYHRNVANCKILLRDWLIGEPSPCFWQGQGNKTWLTGSITYQYHWFLVMIWHFCYFNLPCLFGSDAWSLSFLRSARLKAWLLASGLTSEPWKIGSKKVGICETIFGSLDPNPSIVSTTGTFSLCQDPKTNCHRKNKHDDFGKEAS